MGTALKGKNLLPYGMENQFNHIRLPPLNVAILITHVRNCVMVATTMIL